MVMQSENGESSRRSSRRACVNKEVEFSGSKRKQDGNRLRLPVAKSRIWKQDRRAAQKLSSDECNSAKVKNKEDSEHVVLFTEWAMNEKGDQSSDTGRQHMQIREDDDVACDKCGGTPCYWRQVDGDVGSCLSPFSLSLSSLSSFPAFSTFSVKLRSAESNNCSLSIYKNSARLIVIDSLEIVRFSSPLNFFGFFLSHTTAILA